MLDFNVSSCTCWRCKEARMLSTMAVELEGELIKALAHKKAVKPIRAKLDALYKQEERLRKISCGSWSELAMPFWYDYTPAM